MFKVYSFGDYAGSVTGVADCVDATVNAFLASHKIERIISVNTAMCPCDYEGEPFVRYMVTLTVEE